MTTKRLILAVLTVISLIPFFLSLFGSLNEAQIQSNLELSQTNLLLDATEIQNDLGELSQEGTTRRIIKEVKIEFKHNNSNVMDLAQFLELYDKDCKTKFEICEQSYSEFFYDRFLDEYLKLEQGITEPKPARDVYLKNVYDIKYEHPFFKNMYETKNNKTKYEKNH
jgi:hypothetical protein